MLTLKTAAALLMAGATLAAGLRSARLWLKSSKVQVTPLYAKLGQIEPVGGSQMDWIVGQLEANTETGKLNAKAATWSAATVMLSALASLTNLLPAEGSKPARERGQAEEDFAQARVRLLLDVGAVTKHK